MPLHLLHLVHRRVGDPLQRREIGTDDLDRVGAFDARQAFLDVVLDVLREIEVDAGELLGELLLQLVDQLLLGHSRVGHSSNGFSGTKNSALKKPEASLPLSGRPCCETTVMTSGWRSRISRILCRRSACRLRAIWSAASRRESTDCPLRARAGIRCRAASRRNPANDEEDHARSQP